MEIELLEGFITPKNSIPVIPVKFTRDAQTFVTDNSAPPWTFTGGLLPTDVPEATPTTGSEATPTTSAEATPTQIPDNEAPQTSDAGSLLMILLVLGAGTAGVMTKKKIR